AKPSSGRLTTVEAPTGPGLRLDTFAYTGYTTNPSFDSLLAKLIVNSPSATFGDAASKAYRALCEFRIEGVSTNIGFLQNLLRHPEFAANRVYTRFVEDHAAELSTPSDSVHPRLFFDQQAAPRLAGAKIDTKDPLAVLHHGKSESSSPGIAKRPAPDRSSA